MRPPMRGGGGFRGRGGRDGGGGGRFGGGGGRFGGGGGRFGGGGGRFGGFRDEGPPSEVVGSFLYLTQLLLVNWFLKATIKDVRFVVGALK